MGSQNQGSLWSLMEKNVAITAPRQEEFEITLLGPGYGESLLMHVGGGNWIIVDSCIDSAGHSRALKYLDSISVNPYNAVKLIVATHWHDDHIRGMTELVEVCSSARFCCAATLCTQEFLAAIDALERRHLSISGSGVREIHYVFSQLETRASQPMFALANRLIHNQDNCEIWSLSPDDVAYQSFLMSLGNLFPGEGKGKNRIQAVSPNDNAVVLMVKADDIVLLLGSDLEKHGWVRILASQERPTGKASVFKLPHHGSKNAHVPNVWEKLLEPDPLAVLTPWRRGGGMLPTKQDVRRILLKTENAYITAKHASLAQSSTRRHKTISRTIRESSIRLRQHVMSSGAIRLRRTINSRTPWKVETFGSACNLIELAA